MKPRRKLRLNLSNELTMRIMRITIKEVACLKVSELIKLLKRNRCSKIKSGKKHDHWYSEITGKKFPVPRHPSKEIPTGTLKKILEDAGIE